MASVKLTNVVKKYGKDQTPAVCDFNLEIADKEFVVFVGPSGCGKSTTLRMIAGLEDITDGTIEIDGRIVNDLPPKERGIAMVFQNYALYPNLTVFDNMAFPLRLMRVPITEEESKTYQGELFTEQSEAENEAGQGKKKKRGLFAKRKKTDPSAAPAETGGVPGGADAEAVAAETAVSGTSTGKTLYRKLTHDEITERVLAAAEILGITDFLMRRPKALSGGQRQRVAIGRAIVRDSKVLLLDEPLSNLDAKLRNQMRAEFILLHKKINATFVYVTHDQTEAMTLGDRIVIMKDGYIQQVGTPTQVFDMPSNLFVAEFIGSPKMNTFRTRLEHDEKGYYVSPCGVRMEVDDEKGKTLQAKGVEAQDIVLGVRPEHVSLTKRDNPAAIPCVIQVNEMMGSELHLHVLPPQGDQIIVRIPTVSLDANQLAMLHAHAKIFITFRSKVMHFFNAEDEHNLIADVVFQTAKRPAPDAASLPQAVEEHPKKKWRRMN